MNSVESQDISPDIFLFHPNPKFSSNAPEAIDNTTNSTKIPSIHKQQASTILKTNKHQPSAYPKPNKTFAQAVSNICVVPTSQLPKPILKGDNFSISIPEDAYLVGMEACKHNLHARVIWPKGSTPLAVFDLHNKLSSLWKDLGKWGVSSLGKGYYEFCFSSLEDLKRVRFIASWNLNPGILKFFAWSKDFNPNLQTSSSVQVWLRIYNLPQEYWQSKILFSIANSVGTPICT